MSTKITLENCYGKYSVEVEEDDLRLDEVINQLIEPVLLGATYSRKNIDEMFANVPEG